MIEVDTNIRDMVRGDVPAVAALEELAFPQPWPLGAFYEELALSNRVYLVTEDGEHSVIGYGGLIVVADDAHITTLAVHPHRRRRGLGPRLLVGLIERALARGARNLTLEVRQSNADAQALYQRFGFARVGRRRNYYRDEDAVVMWATAIDGRAYALRLSEIRGALDAEGGE